MKRGKSGWITIALFAVAGTLLSFSVVGSSQAALTYFSETYRAQVEMFDIGVTLVENGEDVSRRDYTGSNDAWNTKQGVLVGKMLNTGANGAKEDLQLGHKYKEELSVRNSGTIDHYMRVTIYKYWEQDGKKRTDLDPSLIDLHLVNTDSAWYLDEASSTPERTVLYYRSILPAGASSVPFTDTLEIQDEGIQARVEKVDQTTDGSGNTVFRTTYTYDGLDFVIQADVDAVQTHNAPEAIRSAWGVEMSAKGMG